MKRIIPRRIPGIDSFFSQKINAAVTYKKGFVSTSQTGTGSPQNILHGLGSTPAKVLVIVTGGHNGAGAAGTQFPTITEGTHTATEAVVTVTAGATYKVHALL